ncbi:hypothetical protein C922_05745 [Plasmodium inui San Antonio 1]|uniref:Uncharacterized protein n=1 Tax=Plasmodium inui San Antonio 1 TaxID=1237626 RepID=W7A458_9APIC|nr:hypothetical protein C922_05745 [Plasmodium inui San Antonio 1]EUD63874.1 hypothetical protein C922_05745 [Plasmodium inui San Antonio 1]
METIIHMIKFHTPRGPITKHNLPKGGEIIRGRKMIGHLSESLSFLVIIQRGRVNRSEELRKFVRENLITRSLIVQR